jgi:hypothetical protein
MFIGSLPVGSYRVSFPFFYGFPLRFFLNRGVFGDEPRKQILVSSLVFPPKIFTRCKKNWQVLPKRKMEGNWDNGLFVLNLKGE